MNLSPARLALIAAALTSIVLMAPAGCATSSSQSVKRSEKAVDSLADFRKQLTSANAQLDKTVAALDALVADTGDREAALAAYSKELVALGKQGDEARKRSESLQARGREYLAKWEQEVSEVSSPELKAQSEARRANAQQRMDEIRVRAEVAANAYRPLLSDLTDIEKVLATDLSAANIQGVAPVAARARKDAGLLKTTIDEFIAVIDQVMSGLGPQSG